MFPGHNRSQAQSEGPEFNPLVSRIKLHRSGPKLDVGSTGASVGSRKKLKGQIWLRLKFY